MTTQLRDLTAEEAETIKRLVQSRAEAARTVERAKVIWLRHQGKKVSAIVKELHVSHDTVMRWTKRFNAEGIAGLMDRPRSGHPPTYTPEQVSEVIAAALSKPQELQLPSIEAATTYWNHIAILSSGAAADAISPEGPVALRCCQKRLRICRMHYLVLQPHLPIEAVHAIRASRFAADRSGTPSRVRAGQARSRLAGCCRVQVGPHTVVVFATGPERLLRGRAKGPKPSLRRWVPRGQPPTLTRFSGAVILVTVPWLARNSEW